MVKRHMKRRSPFIRERQIKTTILLPPHTCQNGSYHKRQETTVLMRMWRKGILCAVGGMQTGAGIMENSKEVSQKNKHRITVKSNSVSENIYISGIVYVYVCVCIYIYSVCVCAKLLQSCWTLCDPLDWSPSGSSVHGILQERILEWVAIPFSRGSSHPRG